MRIGEAGFEQLAKVVNCRVADTIFPRKKKCIFLPREDVVQNVTYGEKCRQECFTSPQTLCSHFIVLRV